MKRNYRGFEIEAKREKCLAGYPLLYYSVFQDGREWDSGFEDSEEWESTKLKQLKDWVDNFYECLEKKKCPLCEEELTPTMNNNLYCEDCDEYFEIST